MSIGNNTTWGQQEWRKLGFASLEDFLVGFWEGFFLDRRDPNNLLCMLETWHDANVGLTTGFFGDHEKALASIKVYPLFPLPQDNVVDCLIYVANRYVSFLPGLCALSLLGPVLSIDAHPLLSLLEGSHSLTISILGPREWSMQDSPELRPHPAGLA